MHGGSLTWAAAVADCSPDSLLDFSASINPLGPPPSVRLALTEAIAHLGHYPDPQYQQLRTALAAHHGLTSDWVLPGNGAAELITWAARDLSGIADGSVYLPTPAFGDYRRALAGFGCTPRPWPLLSQGGVDLASQALLSPATAAAGILINNPHNPTGHLFPQSELRLLLDHASLVVVDEAFMDFLPPHQQQSLVPWLGQYPNLVVLRSLTKFYSLPGLRLGYALGHPDRLGRWQGWRDPWPVNSLAVAAGMAAIADQAFQRRTWQWLPPTRQALWQGLGALPGYRPWPGSANYLLVETDQSVPALQEELLRQHRILIRDCLSFPELGDRYLRVAVRSEAENHRLLAALQSLQPL